MMHAKRSKRKIRVGLIFGGRSGEHQVSLMSAQSVMGAIDKEKYEVVPIGITKTGRWTLADVQLLEVGDAPLPPAVLLGDPSSRALMQVEQTGDQVLTLSSVAELDVILPILHGPYGEDGTVQGLLELAGLPYAGAGVVGSAVAMDKVVFKKVMQAEGLSILPYQLVLRSEWERDPAGTIEQVLSFLDYPIFTKPANLGSSVGVRKCTTHAELEAGMEEAAHFDRRLVVEQGIDAREIECSVLGNDDPIVSIAGEIEPSRDFYSYQAKYLDEGADASGLLIPAPISDALMEQVRSWAIQAYKAIDCAGMARVDFLLEREGRHGEQPKLYINEINTLPGFTSISMYPKLWEASGIPYPELIDRLIELALDRHADKERTQISYDG
jgi:D-alanine-D-alanine ligase